MKMIAHTLRIPLHLPALLLIPRHRIIALAVRAIARRDGLFRLLAGFAKHGAQFLDFVFEAGVVFAVVGDGFAEFFVFVLPGVEFLADGVAGVGEGCWGC
jgi:hypothetical protein